MPSRWVHEHRFPDREALAAALAGEIKVDLEEAIAARGAASLVVSGGRTPLRLFAQLRSEKLDWTTTWVTLADERWVETTSEDSNERFVRENLLVGPAAAAHFVGLEESGVDARSGSRLGHSCVDPRAASVRRRGARDGRGRSHRFAVPGIAGAGARARARRRLRRASPSTRWPRRMRASA